MALSEVDDIIEAHEAEKARNVRLLEQLAKQEATNAKLLTDKIHESQIVARHAEERDFAEAAAGRAKEDATNLRHCVNAVEGQLQVGGYIMGSCPTLPFFCSRLMRPRKAYVYNPGLSHPAEFCSAPVMWHACLGRLGEPMPAG